MHGEPAILPLYFGVLGSLQCRVGEDPVPLRGPMQERLLTYLLVSRGQVVPVSRLVEAVWDEEFPDTATHQVRKMVSDLRRRIPPLRERLTTAGPGYQLALDEDDLDHGRFLAGLRLTQEALRGGPRQPRRAIGHLSASLALWRGPLLDGQGGALLRSISHTLEERRVAAFEQLFDLRLKLDESDAVLPALREATAEYPTRETLRGQLMLALYRAGCQAEALEEYHRLRRVLDESYGVEPGADLGVLYQRMLHADPELAPRTAAPSGPDPAAAPESWPPVNTLPYDLHDFTGRAEPMAVIQSIATGRGRGAGPRIIAVGGMGGSGKSALVVHAAHRLTGWYPDAQLYLDLQGFTPGVMPMSEYEALAVLLAAVGVPDGSLPTDPRARVALWRTTTRRLRFALVLDNAADASQVRGLLPNSPECLVLITSRRLLLDLDGVVPVRLDMLTLSESVELVERVLGRERVQAEPEAARQLAELCGRLPLALRISAARLQQRVHWSLGQFVEKLSERSRTLAELAVGDRSLEACLSTSFDVLEPALGAALVVLGTLPGTEFGESTAAAALGLGLAEAEAALESLLDAHMIEQPAADRYSLHDLVRDFAAGQARSGHAESTGEALARLLDYYARATEHACGQLFPGRTEHPLAADAGCLPVPRLVDGEAALAWFDIEHRAICAAVAVEWSPASAAAVYRVARNLVFYQHMRGLTDALANSASIGLAAARALGDHRLIQAGLANLATAQWSVGRFGDAVAPLQEALDLAERAGDERGQISILNRLNACHERLGEYRRCEEMLRRILGLLAANPAPQEEAITRNALSVLHLVRGEFDAAVRECELALELGVGVDTGTRINLLNSLAEVHLAGPRPEQAESRLAEALELERRTGRTQAGTNTLCQLAELSLARGDVKRANQYANEALNRLNEGPRLSVHWCVTYSTAGRVGLADGRLGYARECYTSALDAAEQSGYWLEAARAHTGLAAVASAAGDEAAAAEHGAAAARISAELDIPRPKALRT